MKLFIVIVSVYNNYAIDEDGVDFVLDKNDTSDIIIGTFDSLEKAEKAFKKFSKENNIVVEKTTEKYAGLESHPMSGYSIFTMTLNDIGGIKLHYEILM